MTPSFKIPEDYSPPSGVKEGDEFSEIATFKFDGDKMVIVNVGEDKTPVEGHDEKKEESTKKPKGAKEAIKEQLGSMEDKSGSDSMGDTGEEGE